MVDPSAQRAKEPWRILVIDDEQTVQAVLDRMFQRMGQSVRGVMTAADAMALLPQPWDLFIIDKNLPEGSGIEVARAARAANPEAIIILVTGFASRDSAEALVGVVDEYITKPFELNYLRETITALMDFRQVGRLARAIAAPQPQPSPSAGPGPQSRPSPPPLAGPSDAARASSPSGLTRAPPVVTAPTPQPQPSPPPQASSPSGLLRVPSSSPSGLTRAPGSSPSPAPLGAGPTSPSGSRRALGGAATLLSVHIVLSDARDEATLLSEARKAGVSANSGPLSETNFPDVLIIDGKSASLELRKAVWLRQARTPPLRVVMVVEGTSLGDATAAVALRATHRLARPLTPEAAAQLMKSLKG